MGVPLERRSHGSFYRRKGSEVIFDDNVLEAEKRKQNRERVGTQQESPISSLGGVDIIQHEVVGSDRVNNRPKRKTRGKGRTINYKQP